MVVFGPAVFISMEEVLISAAKNLLKRAAHRM